MGALIPMWPGASLGREQGCSPPFFPSSHFLGVLHIDDRVVKHNEQRFVDSLHLVLW